MIQYRRLVLWWNCWFPRVPGPSPLETTFFAPLHHSVNSSQLPAHSTLDVGHLDTLHSPSPLRWLHPFSYTFFHMSVVVARHEHGSSHQKLILKYSRRTSEWGRVWELEIFVNQLVGCVALRCAYTLERDICPCEHGRVHSGNVYCVTCITYFRPPVTNSISVQQILNVPCTRLRHLSKHLTNLGRFCLCFPWLKQILIAVLSSYIFQVQGVMGALGTPTWLNQEILHLRYFDFSSVSITIGAIRLNHPGYCIDLTTCRMNPLSAREDRNLSELTVVLKDASRLVVFDHLLVIVGMITTVRLLQWLSAHSDSRKTDNTHPRWSLPICTSTILSMSPVVAPWSCKTTPTFTKISEIVSTLRLVSMSIIVESLKSSLNHHIWIWVVPEVSLTL